jgi:hypothetical protein
VNYGVELSNTLQVTLDMPSIKGFSDNPFKTRSDFIRAGITLLKPLDRYKSQGKARIRLATDTGTGFSETAAQLEGFARPLFFAAHLLGKGEEQHALYEGVELDSWIIGLRNGTDPGSSEYWGTLGDFDQRMVEMESIAYALLVSPAAFHYDGDQIAGQNIATWLRQINQRVMPQNNWRWFRVFVNLALVKTLDVPVDEVWKIVQDDLELLDTFYIADGWSSDGIWGGERKQADYYSGSFAIQFAQLLYVKFASDLDPERIHKYVLQAQEFAIGFWRYFGVGGKSDIPMKLRECES